MVNREARWDQEQFKELRGTVWKPNPNIHDERIRVPESEGPLTEPAEFKPTAEKRLRNDSQDVKQRGLWPSNCIGCRMINQGRKAQGHTEGCRKSVEAMLTEKGDPRIERYNEKLFKAVFEADPTREKRQTEGERPAAKRQRSEPPASGAPASTSEQDGDHKVIDKEGDTEMGSVTRGKGLNQILDVTKINIRDPEVRARALKETKDGKYLLTVADATIMEEIARGHGRREPGLIREVNESLAKLAWAQRINKLYYAHDVHARNSDPKTKRHHPPDAQRHYSSRVFNDTGHADTVTLTNMIGAVDFGRHQIRISMKDKKLLIRDCQVRRESLCWSEPCTRH